ncbi:c-type cytochrome domain-containing protein [Prosthecobacter sp.]|uniref:c-type cytochrome domain-containing protein n=1 Tax=Prosthecobacter sp. TaxID=1965333 RepID=UPI002ABA24B0|nr:c-type cytochrome domain-containing protein [Prosthecobacter sp.]MDZ4401649.1 c-type cytochrome domain-containing protein [Prosthecobacter sp.]
MNLLRSILLLVLSLATSHAQTVDYTKQIAPLWDTYCIDCHSADDADGEFVLDTFAALMKGGKEGAAIVAGKGNESMLVKFLEGRSGRGGKNEFMPPGKREKLKPEEIALIKAWIDAGAKGPIIAEGKPMPKEVITPKIMPTVPPKRSIQAVAFSSKVQLIAVGRYGEVELLNPVTRAVIRKLTGIKGKANAVAFSPDGDAVYAAGGEAGIVGEVKRWKTSDGTLQQSFDGHLDAAYALAVSPDGKLIATGAYDQKIRLWDTATGKEVALLKGHNGAVNGLSFRPDGKVLASASADRTVKLWAIPTGQRLETLSQPTKEQTSVVFSADGKQLFAAGSDNRIRLWNISADAKEGTNKIVTSRFAHEGGILRLALSLDGKLLASTSTDKSLKLWSTADLTEKLPLEKQPDWSSALAFTDKAQLVAGRIDGTLSVYESTTGKTVMAPAPAKPAVAKKAAAKAAMAAKPTITTITPRGLHNGMEQQLVITGKELANATVQFADARLKPAVDAAASSPTKLVFKVKVPADLPRGGYEVSARTAQGETAKVKLFADDIAPTTSTAADFKAAPVVVANLPASLWGTLTEIGQHDAYRFTAKAGEELVLDLAVAQIGSTAKSPTLEIMDTNRTVLAVNRGLDSGSDPFLAWKAPADGDYIVLVSNTTMDGSADHAYRLTIGALPYVTAWSPLAAQVGKDTKVTLIGHHLGDKASVMMKADKEGLMNVPLDAKTLRFRSMPVLRASARMHVDGTTTHEVTAPVTVNGVLGRKTSFPTRSPEFPNELENSFYFTAKKGQTWIIETLAAQAGSPADTKLDILHADGQPVPRVMLQAVRDSYNNFRSVDANNPDIRLQNWEEMELNEFVYFNGDVMKIVRMPRGPDGGCFFYINGGKRRAYFDTSATSHSLDEPCYVVEPRPIGSQIVPNGLPVFTLNYANDDSDDRKLGSDSRLTFTAPADGRYIVKVTDTRGWNGERFVYALTIREPKPDFTVKLAGANPTVMPGASIGFSFRADRVDDFDDPIQIDITGLPQGYFASSPLLIEAGHDLISGSLHAAPDAKADANWSQLKITAKGKGITHDAGTFGKVTLGAVPKFIIVMEPDNGGKAVMREIKDETKPLEITLVPGQTVKAWIRAVRQGNDGLINLDVHGLPHGVIVDDIGLNGVQIREKENERPIFFRAANWVQDQDKLVHAALSSARNEHDSAGLQTCFPMLLKIRKVAGVAVK